LPGPYQSMRTLTILSAACPSHNFGMQGGFPSPGERLATSKMILRGSEPTSRSVPSSIVTGALRIRAFRQTGDAEDGGLLLDSPRIGDDIVGMAHQVQEI